MSLSRAVGVATLLLAAPALGGCGPSPEADKRRWEEKSLEQQRTEEQKADEALHRELLERIEREKSNEDDAAVELRLAQRLIEQGRRKRAREILDDLVRQHPYTASAAHASQLRRELERDPPAPARPPDPPAPR